MIKPKNTPKSINDISTDENRDGSLRRSVLILKSRPHTGSTFEQFLSRRNWDLHEVFDLRDLLLKMSEVAPQYVMVPVDHPDQKVALLPQLLTQAFDCIVIPYAEDTSSQSIARLKKIDVGNCLYPPTSGPAFERLALKLNKNADLGSKDRDVISLGSTLSQNHVINIKGHRGQIMSAEAEVARARILQIAQESNPSSTLNFHSLPAEHPLYKSSIKHFTRSTVPDSIIARGTENALEYASLKKDYKDLEFIADGENVASLKVKSSKFKGHLVVVFGNDRVADKKFLDSIRDRLQDFMHNQGEDFYFEEAVQVSIKKFTFNDWAQRKADFVRSNVHEGAEVAVGFFPGEIDELLIETSAEQEYLAVPLENIYTDTELTFDFYLHLKANKKYILYAVMGATFEQSQKDRLLSKGIDKVHFKREALKDVQGYHLRKYLNAEITALL